MVRHFAVFAVLCSMVACGDSSTSTSCPAGGERCACYRNQTCNTGLKCFSSVCVRDTRGVDGAAQDSTGAGGASSAGDSAGADTVPAAGGSGGSTLGSGGLDASISPSGGASGAGGIETLDAKLFGDGGALGSGGVAQGGAAGARQDAALGTGGSVGSGGAGAGGSKAGNGGNNASGGSGQGGTWVATSVGSGGAADGGLLDAGQGGAAGTGGGGGTCGGTGGSYVLYDGFECGTSQWTPQPSAAFVVVADGSNTYQATDASTVFASFSYAKAGSPTWSNVRVEVRVKAISFTTADSNSYVSVYGRFADAKNYFAIQWLGSGAVSTSDRKNGAGSDIHGPTPILTTGQWYTLRIDFSGTELATYVDDQLVQRLGLNAVTSGSIAIGARDAVARFDDVRVTPL
jgi:hypothetical protein